MDKNADIRTIDNVVRAMPTDDGSMKISGTAIVFNQPSQDMGFIEYIKPDAVRGIDFSQTMLLYNHDPANILARSNANNLNIAVTDTGVQFEATLPDTTLSKDVYEGIRSGNLQGCSFGFRIAPDGDEWETRDDGTIIHTINQIQSVGELSITPIPAYLQTSVGVKRALDKAKEELKVPKDKVNDQPNVDLEEKEDEIRALKEKLKQTEDENKNLKDEKAALEEEAKKAKEEPKTNPKEDSEEAESDDKEGEDKKPSPKKEKKMEEKRSMHKKNITPESAGTKDEVRAFADYLKNGSKYDRRDVSGIGLPVGRVIIPKTILTPEQKQYQFPRLSGLVRTVSVKTTTGMLPLFDLADGTLAEHSEFAETTPNNAPAVQEIDWKLQTYTGRYVFSQELMSDSTYDWQSELSSCLITLRDNTDDSLIMQALTTNPTNKVASSTDVIADLKKALNVNLQPMDSQQATVIVSQSAFNYLDTLTDKIGRPLINENLTEGMGKQLLGHQLVVVPDTLFPSAKAGDINLIVAPLKKAVINFKQSEITGQFQDTSDVWYKQLGIFLREDVVAARPDLVTTIKAAASVSAATSSTSPDSGK